VRIKHLKLLNFRNHKKIEIDFNKTNILLGPNGCGKTSILESIFLISTSKSPRTSKNFDLINWQKSKSFIELTILDNDNQQKVFRLLLSRKTKEKNKTFSIGGIIVGPKDIIGRIKTVYFSPETLEIINGNPSERRRFIDILLSQVNPKYLADLIEYKKILINRNTLLKEIYFKKREREEIIFWDMKLIEVGSRIMRARNKAIISLSKPLNNFHKIIIEENNEPDPAGGGVSGRVRWQSRSSAASTGLKSRQRRDIQAIPNKNNLEIKYHPSFALDEGIDGVENSYTERIAREFDFEIKYGNTLYGPHRDDIRFQYLDHDVASFCSRGEIRSIIIALKLAEAEYIKQKKGDSPVILLDDIFSELDDKRIAKLGKFIIKDYQSIISTVDANIIPIMAGRKNNIIKLKKGKACV